MPRITIWLWLAACLATAADVPSVENGLTPKDKTYTLDFVEDLRIGGGGEDYLIWTGSYISAQVNDQGHIFVQDSGGNRILEFDGDGQFLRQIGRPGKGPGEFTSLYSFHILKDQSAIAFDNQQSVTSLCYFDRDMNFLRRDTHQPNQIFIQSVDFSPDGKLVGAMYITDVTNGGTVHRGILDREFKQLLDLSSAPRIVFDNSRATDLGWWAEFLAGWFKVAINGSGVVAFAPDGSVYTATSDRYEITKWTPDLKKVMVVSKKYKPIPQPEEQVMALVEPIYEEVVGLLPASLKSLITPSLIKRAVDLAEFPPRKLPIFAILPMEDGAFLVVHDYNPASGVSKADIFTAGGQFAGTSVLPKIGVNVFAGMFGSPTKLIFSHGKAYAMIPDEDMEVTLVRYRYELKPL